MVRTAWTALALILVVASTGQPAHALQEPTTHVMVEGETLAQLAREYLGDAARWTEIARANGITDPHRVHVGTELAIPTSSEPATAESSGRASTETAEPLRGAGASEPQQSDEEAEPTASAELETAPDQEERVWRIEQAERLAPAGGGSAFRSEEANRQRNQVRETHHLQRMAVPRDAFYSAEWLVMGETRPMGYGTLQDFLAMDGARRFQGATARPFDELEIATEGDFSPREGDELQVFRVVRQVEGMGWVVRPTGED